MLRMLGLFAFIFSATFGTAATRTVTTTLDSGPGSLRQAIADSAPGDIITFGLPSHSTIQLTSGELTIDKNLTISGPGASELTVSASNVFPLEFRVFSVGPGSLSVTLSGLTLAHGGGFLLSGGGLLNQSTGNVELHGCVVIGNSAGVAGGGVYNSGRLAIVACVISANRVGGLENSRYGGGIFNAGSLTVINSTIAANTVRSSHQSLGLERGGGICSTGDLYVGNSTISGNDAALGGGGGIGVTGGTAIFTNVTVSDNSPGGISTANAQSQLRNSIIAGNRAFSSTRDIFGPITSLGYNLVGDGRDATIVETTGDQIGTAANPLDPLLGPLQDNGGSTPTHALLPGSTAIDKGGSADGLTTDQRGRGFPRTFDDPANPNAHGGDGTDIGAFEVQTTTEQPARLGNISSRARVETGDNVLIGGFIISGTQPKKVLIRAIGPSLPITDRLEDPTLDLFGPSGLIDSNNNWVDSPDRQRIIETTIPPTNDLESAIIADLPANKNAYTAIVRGLENSTGIGLVEVFDLDASVNSRLANISSRGFVQTGDKVIIGGVIVQGQTSARVIIRAIGPSLGVTGALANPTLDLRDENGTLLQANDDWRSDQEAEIVATTIPPSNDLESAIVRTLPPANYTAIVRGVNDATGIALIEVYDLR